MSVCARPCGCFFAFDVDTWDEGNKTSCWSSRPMDFPVGTDASNVEVTLAQGGEQGQVWKGKGRYRQVPSLALGLDGVLTRLSG